MSRRVYFSLNTTQITIIYTDKERNRQLQYDVLHCWQSVHNSMVMCLPGGLVGMDVTELAVWIWIQMLSQFSHVRCA